MADVRENMLMFIKTTQFRISSQHRISNRLSRPHKWRHLQAMLDTALCIRQRLPMRKEMSNVYISDKDSMRRKKAKLFSNDKILNISTKHTYIYI